MKRQTSGPLFFCLAALLLTGAWGCATFPDKRQPESPPRIQLDELKARLGDPTWVIIDVRAEVDPAENTPRIKGAVLEIYNQVAAWAPKYPRDKTIVLYCA